MFGMLARFIPQIVNVASRIIPHALPIIKNVVGQIAGGGGEGGEEGAG
jgi:hypothetical protein